VVTACRDAKTYVTAAIAHADELQIGHGAGPLNHFYRQWREP
jgi:hydroxymethylpyrimidine/phosphomethylpyrimidine kinase